MKRAILSLLIIIVFVLQTTLFEYIKIYGVKPNLLPVLVILFSMFGGSFEGGAFGFVIGLITDLHFSKYFGFNSILFTYCGVCFPLVYNKLMDKGYIITFVSSFIFVFVYDFMFYFLTYYVWGHGALAYIALNVLLIEAVYSAILSLLLLHVFKAIYKDNEEF